MGNIHARHQTKLESKLKNDIIGLSKVSVGLQLNANEQSV